MRMHFIALSSSVCLGGLACDGERFSNAEFRAAIDEVVLTGDAVALQDGVVEITTSFTLAQGVEAVVQEVAAFLESQAPCSTVDSPSPGTLVIDFGELEDQCTYRGNTYAGVVTVSFEVGEGQVVVTHDYAQLTNGRVTLDGSAVVTWADASRHVVTEFSVDGNERHVDIDSDRTQTLVGGLGDGIRVDGERNWHGSGGSWHLDIDGVEMRGRDPVPQAGTYTLTTPEDKDMSLSFDRIDEDTIAVTIAGGRRERTFHVTSTAEVSE
jgi:hypothetical protein